MRGIQLVLLGVAITTATIGHPCQNPIACENLLPGDTGWEIDGIGDLGLQGFVTEISVNAGEKIVFKVNSDAPSYRIDIYRLGYYGGAGARKITTLQPLVSGRQTQPECLIEARSKLVDCGNWAVSAAWQAPSTAVSGIYIARLVRSDTEAASHIVFIVRNDASRSDILFKTADETWQAYNSYGGSSLEANDRATKASYNRPFFTRAFHKDSWLFSSEYAMIRWLEANGFDVTYITSVDAAKYGNLLLNHKVIVTAGLDQYVSGPHRANTEAARDAGISLAFFTASEAFWKTKWEASVDSDHSSYRTLVCYKETLNEGRPNESDPLTWTGAWRDPRFSPPSDGGHPENSLTGSAFLVNDPDGNGAIEITPEQQRLRFWRNAAIAPEKGGTATLAAGTLGPKWDGELDNGLQPAGVMPLTSTLRTLNDGVLLDFGARYGAGSAIHRASLYRVESGALVFNAGSTRWAWGLDEHHDGDGFVRDTRMQQATINLFADMNVQPTTILAQLRPAAKSEDRTPPTSILTSRGPVQHGTRTTLTGTATDTGGGVVAAVEVSVDNGRTWRSAIGTENWSYEWLPFSLTGAATVLVRATDDSGNIETTPTATTFKITGAVSIWPVKIAAEAAADTQAVELGMKFQSDMAGYVTAVRFYKAPGSRGPYLGRLWNSDGTLLADVKFTDETASGWQEASLPSPVPISANTTYVVSYFAPNGIYAARPRQLRTRIDEPPLHVLADGADGPNGIYVYGRDGGFPTDTFNATNYLVDVVFVAAVAPPHSVTLSWKRSSSEGVIGYNVYRSTTPKGWPQRLNKEPVTTNSFTDAHVVPGKTYYYVTTAIGKTNVESAPSNQALATIPIP